MIRELKDFVQSYIPLGSYIKHDFGYTNLLFTAPHGGGAKPFNIKDRTTGKRLQDTYTRRLTSKLVELMYNSPYYVVSDIHRKKVDLNRDLPEATDGDRKAQTVWYNYHNKVSLYKSEMLSLYRTGLLVDIHSHNNSDEFQLGYNISARDYLALRLNKRMDIPSTLDSFTDRNYLWDMIFGYHSITNSIEKYGYKVFTPNTRDEFFNGGYTVERYAGEGLGSIQIEVPVSLLKYDLDGAARVLKDSITIFSNKFM